MNADGLAYTEKGHPQEDPKILRKEFLLTEEEGEIVILKNRGVGIVQTRRDKDVIGGGGNWPLLRIVLHLPKKGGKPFLGSKEAHGRVQH